MKPDLDAQQRLEATIRAHADRGAFKEATTTALEGYGPELLGFAMALLRDEAAAGDVFSQLCEDIWSGLPGFQWHSSFRTWAYAVARHAVHRHLRSPHVRRNRPLADEDVSQLADRVRSTTLNYLRTEVKEKVTQIREKLDPDDQALLILRVDRNLAWNEVAEILLGEDEGEGREAIARKAAALRKRFERLKDELRRLAREHGLIQEE